MDDIPAAVRDNLEIMKDRRVDVMGCSKTNVEWNSYPLHLTTHLGFEQVLPQGKWITTASEIQTPTDFKPRGNAMGYTTTSTTEQM